MEPAELLRHASQLLDRLAVPYLVTGSVASMVYGEPRFTNDIDIVAALSFDQVPEFCAGFPSPEFYCSPEAVCEAVLKRFQSNILHPESGLKIDVMIPSDTEYNRSRLKRGVRLMPAEGFSAWFAAPEDVILKKLEYYREGGSEKHLRDIASMLKFIEAELDRDYLRTWAAKLGLFELWQQISGRPKDEDR